MMVVRPAEIFTDLLTGIGHGTPAWPPEIGPLQLGDVGIIDDDGRFVRVSQSFTSHP